MDSTSLWEDFKNIFCNEIITDLQKIVEVQRKLSGILYSVSSNGYILYDYSKTSKPGN